MPRLEKAMRSEVAASEILIMLSVPLPEKNSQLPAISLEFYTCGLHFLRMEFRLYLNVFIETSPKHSLSIAERRLNLYRASLPFSSHWILCSLKVIDSRTVSFSVSICRGCGWISVMSQLRFRVYFLFCILHPSLTTLNSKCKHSSKKQNIGVEFTYNIKVCWFHWLWFCSMFDSVYPTYRLRDNLTLSVLALAKVVMNDLSLGAIFLTRIRVRVCTGSASIFNLYHT